MLIFSTTGRLHRPSNATIYGKVSTRTFLKPPVLDENFPQAAGSRRELALSRQFSTRTSLKRSVSLCVPLLFWRKSALKFVQGCLILHRWRISYIPRVCSTVTRGVLPIRFIRLRIHAILSAVVSVSCCRFRFLGSRDGKRAVCDALPI